MDITQRPHVPSARRINISDQLNPITNFGHSKDAIRIESGSLPNLPLFSRNMLALSPLSHRRRQRNISKRNLDILAGSSPPKGMAHLPRDPTQPSYGSVADVHRTTNSSEDEELDTFPVTNNFRPRSNTCPESRLMRRKVRVRTRNRPLTPPPGGADDCEITSQLSKLAIKEKFHIHSVPLSIPENSSDYGSNYKDRQENNATETTFDITDEDIFSMDE